MSGENGISVFAPKSKRKRQLKTAAQPPAQPSTGASIEPVPTPVIEEEAIAKPPENESGAAVQILKDDTESVAGFRELGVTQWLDRVCTSLGMQTPTAVQRGCIPAILEVSSRKYTCTDGHCTLVTDQQPLLPSLGSARS